VNGEARDSHDRWTEQQRRTWAELLGVLGPVKGPDGDAEMAAVADDPPWQPVSPEDATELVIAYVKADRLASCGGSGGWTDSAG